MFFDNHKSAKNTHVVTLNLDRQKEHIILLCLKELHVKHGTIFRKSMNPQRLFSGVHVSRRTHYTHIETHYLHTAACVCILMETKLTHYNMTGHDYPDRHDRDDIQ